MTRVLATAAPWRELLPPGFTARGATVEDAEAVTALARDAERFDAGEASVTIEDIQSEWDSPGVDLQDDALLVFEGNVLVAEAEVPGWRAEANVHPSARGQGIGVAVLSWVEYRALERVLGEERVRVGQTVISTNTDAISLFLDHGYSVRHTSWVLRLPDDVTIDPQPTVDGLEIRPFDPGSEEHAVHQIVEDAFNEWPTRVPSTFVEWRSGVTKRSDFDPSLLLVAVFRGDVVGVAFGIPYEDEGWVQQLAVRSDHRGRGIAKALLGELFEKFRGRGLPAVGLSTDSRTGALDLYLGLGMVVRDAYSHYSKLLER
jgi:GNAT superfamily N-acetyltransferase